MPHNSMPPLTMGVKRGQRLIPIRKDRKVLSGRDVIAKTALRLIRNWNISEPLHLHLPSDSVHKV